MVEPTDGLDPPDGQVIDFLAQHSLIINQCLSAILSAAVMLAKWLLVAAIFLPPRTYLNDKRMLCIAGATGVVPQLFLALRVLLQITDESDVTFTRFYYVLLFTAPALMLTYGIGPKRVIEILGWKTQ